MVFRVFFIWGWLAGTFVTAGPVMGISLNGGSHSYVGQNSCQKLLAQMTEVARDIRDLTARDPDGASLYFVRLLRDQEVQSLVLSPPDSRASDADRRKAIAMLADVLLNLDAVSFDSVINSAVFRSETSGDGSLAEVMGDLWSGDLLDARWVESFHSADSVDPRIRRTNALQFYTRADQVYCGAGECEGLERVRRKISSISPPDKLAPREFILRQLSRFKDLVAEARHPQHAVRLLKDTEGFTWHLANLFQELKTPDFLFRDQNFERLYLIGIMRLNVLLEEEQIPEAIELFSYLSSIQVFIPEQKAVEFNSFEWNLSSGVSGEFYAPGLQKRLSGKLRGAKVLGQFPENKFWAIDYVKAAIESKAKKYYQAFHSLGRAITQLQNLRGPNLRSGARDSLVAKMEAMRAHLRVLDSDIQR